MKARIGAWVLAALSAPLAHADGFSYVGSLDPTNPNDVFVTSFTLQAQSAVTVQTWSFGGGTNAAGSVIAAGGFDPYLTLFSGAGAGATFLASNDDGLCPPGRAALACADSTLTTAPLAACTYALVSTLPFNYSSAENHGSGTLGDGFIGLDSSFDDGSCAQTGSSLYALDINYTVPVPEPATWALLGAGLSLLAVARRRRATSGITRPFALSSSKEFS